MAYVDRSSTKFTEKEFLALVDQLAPSFKGVDPSLVAHTCLQMAFVLYAQGGATREQVMEVCNKSAEIVGLPRAN